jgi:hypothetical protein
MIEETHVSLQRKTSMLEEKLLAHCFPQRIELGFENNTSCNVGSSRWR